VRSVLVMLAPSPHDIFVDVLPPRLAATRLDQSTAAGDWIHYKHN